MTDLIKSKWKQARVSVKVLLCLGAVGCLVLGLAVMAVDSDSDGMHDAYETLFRLDANDPADAALDYDGDGLDNFAEHALGTDPWQRDTDRDGWTDDVDLNPVSRLFIDWGAPLYCVGNSYDYTGPAWWVSAGKAGGLWQTNPACWFVSSSESNDVGALYIDIDRTQLTNDIVCAIRLADNSGATLYVDLYDTNGVVVVADLFGNLIGGTGVEIDLLLEIPLVSHSDAVGILIRRGTGEIRVYESLLYVDEDGDGLDADQEAQLGTSDQSVDTDGDGMSDAWEISIGFDPLYADIGGVPEDGLALWIRADDLAGGSAVDVWPDRGGRGNHLTQSVPSSRPVVVANAVQGQSAVDFDGANDFLVGQLGGMTGSVSVLAVCRFDALSQPAGDYDYVLRMGTDQSLRHLSISRCAAGYASGWDDAYYSYMGGALVSKRGPVLPGQQWLMIEAVHSADGTAHRVFVNGVEEPAEQYSGSLILDGSVELGRYSKPGFANHYLNGQIAEALVYDRAIEDAERQAIAEYLKARYVINGRPEVDAGVDQETIEGLPVTLNGLAGDDGLPNPPGQLGCQWTKTSGPGEVSFADATAPRTTATFSGSGAYVLRLTASDGALSAHDDVRVTVSVAEIANVPTNALRLWVKADDLPLDDGAPVAQWPDAGGLQHDLTQSDAGAQPVFRVDRVNGQPAVDFDGANDFLVGQLGGMTGSVSVVTVCRFDALSQPTGDYDYVLRMGTDQSLRHLSISRCAAGYASGWDDAYYSYMGGALVSKRGPVLPGQQWLMIEAVHSASGTAHRVFVNGVEETAEPYSGSLTLDGSIELGRYSKPGFANHYLNGQIAEVLVYDRVLQVQDRFWIHAYCKAKYGMPQASDVDGDGISDALEVAIGRDPTVADNYTALPFFEGFEAPAVVTGELDGQRNWTAEPPGAAMVWTNEVFDGAQALRTQLANTSIVARVSHVFAAAPEVVWMDVRHKSYAALPPTNALDIAAAFFFDKAGRLVVGDGPTPSGGAAWVTLTNHAPRAFDVWARLTTRLDYETKTWLICLDGTIVAENLAFVAPIERFTTFETLSREERLDNLYVGVQQPPLLSLDWDHLPDEWELLHFGHFDFGDEDDPEDDGLTNLQEYQAGTDPDNPDTDGDGLVDGWEVQNGLEPTNPDTDGDGMPDGWEVASGFDPLGNDAALDADGDGLTNLQEYQLGANPTNPDSDGDGLADGWEVQNGLDPTNPDTDGDGMPDGWEVAHGFNPLVNDAMLDADGDGLTNLQEFQLGTNPLIADTDGDGLADGWEVQNGLDPTNPDTDGDGMPDGWEVAHGFNPLVNDAMLDADGDDLTNLQEFQAGTDPLNPDTDGDGMPDGWEVANGLNPLVNDAALDADGDGASNLLEYLRGSDPRDAEDNNLSLLLSLNGIDTSKRIGTWEENGTDLVAASNMLMRVEYDVSITNAGMYVFGARIFNADTNTTWTTSFGLQLLIDGVPIEWLSPAVAPGAAVWVYSGTLPYMSAGTHTLRLAWLDDSIGGELLGIKTIVLKEFDGVDANANGIQDWVEAILATGVDSDGDGLSDLAEIEHQPAALEPLAVDTDGDTLSDYDELYIFGTDPLLADSDADGIGDTERLSEKDGVDTSFRELVTLNNRDWYEYDGTLVNLNDNAPVFYDFSVTHAGMHRIGLHLINYRKDMTADYRFLVRISVNGHRIGTISVFADIDSGGRGYINTPWLNAGTHRIGLQWLNNAHGAGGRRGADIGIEKVRLYGINAPDSDGDGIQDWEENLLAAATATDTDGDGLSDRDEVLIHGTSPVRVDTDGDGLSDYDEVMIYDTNPLNPDTDGDGVSDGEEVRESMTNPLSADFDGTITDVDVVNGSETNSGVGNWVVSGTMIVAKNRRGYVEYTLTAPASDCYRILVEATHDALKATCTPVPPIDTSELMVYIDGRYLGKKTLVAPDGVFGDVRAFTPYIGPGDHTVRVFWENVHSRVSLRIRKLRLQSLGGADSDGDGVKDWVESTIVGTTGLDSARLGTDASGLTSVVSPVCLEGPVRYIDMMSCTVGTNAIEVNRGVGERWYADVDLSAVGPTEVNLSFLDGAVGIVTNFTWTPLDLLDVGDLILRKDDALMLNVMPEGETNGTVTIAIAKGGVSVTNLSTTLDQPVTHRFDAAGVYTVSGQFGNQNLTTNGSITVEIMEGSFPTNSPACLLGKPRTWPCPNMPDSAVIEHDDTVNLAFANNTMTLTMWKANGDRYAVARVSEGGPILDSTKLNPFWAQGAVDGYMWVVEQYEDSVLWENRLVFKNVPDDVDIQLRIYAGGCTFDDYSLERWITNADLDANGEYTLGLIIPTGGDPYACHEVNLYQNGVLLGQAYYSGVLMPIDE